jgi:DNA-binding NarL/FixJ family response regulator
LVVVNASRDPILREERAKALNDAGFYTASAQTPDEAINLTTQVKPAIAILCPSFTDAERRAIGLRIHKEAPATTVILLGKSTAADSHAVVSAVRAVLASRSDLGSQRIHKGTISIA